MSSHQTIDRIGPILYFRGYDDDGMRLAVMIVQSQDLPAPAQISTASAQVFPACIQTVSGLNFWRYDFVLAVEEGGYRLGDDWHAVVTDLSGDLRLGFVSCNGEENGDLDRESDERNVMWSRLARDHAEAPFALLLQGGDQVYADEATKDHPLSEDWPEHAPDDPDPGALADLRRHLQDRFAERYMRVLSASACAGIFATVPTLCIWDDHDICDGWGSLPRELTESQVGQAVFSVARQMYLLFQHGGTEADIPDLFWDPTGQNLGWQYQLPGLTIFAPDLRSERGRNNVMGPAGWKAVEALQPKDGHTIMVSSVPLLGPRLSLLESVMMAIPRMQHYEDDLRDQWQSHAHRAEWRRMLTEVLRLRDSGPVTVVSGEIHLATRAEMAPSDLLVNQLVASGISHRAPPRAYARALGLFAGLGEAPLPGHPIRIKPLPGQKHRYIAERNFLTLQRRSGRWSAQWSLEDSGVTPALPLD
ncbi:alkaline phosphatase D family protein [Paracoccus fistulariae]|uniref:Alkaline phosphatase family protein n=1 Tax=Paracoccus fistulariae TaxID=658446 RepID=A0ABY7SPJ9_9RHOB|nr:alkaline phosphatase D family protein [Paracoccus fistulariae]MDB6180300.1 alkaline phosphatase D family protein [Paracoccus fistulariae]WCR08382.1 alkaline phosphatase family protein [Paracoccus fistulariae]